MLARHRIHMKSAALIFSCAALAVLGIVTHSRAQTPTASGEGGKGGGALNGLQKVLPADTGAQHAGGDPVRAADSGFDTRTASGRAEIEWVERRLAGEIHLALSEYYISDISVDVVTRTVIVVFDSMIELTDSLKEQVTKSVVFFTGFDASRVMVVNDRPF